MPENNSSNGAQTNGNNSGNGAAATSTVVFTKIPGVDMTQVIASPPHLIKENSFKVETNVIIAEHHDRG
ncbi:MAG TPA: hypothetical protein VKR53_18910 [Puia sp.]|nr:hypothetical protein [Puia sp.]